MANRIHDPDYAFASRGVGNLMEMKKMNKGGHHARAISI